MYWQGLIYQGGVQSLEQEFVTNWWWWKIIACSMTPFPTLSLGLFAADTRDYGHRWSG